MIGIQRHLSEVVEHVSNAKRGKIGRGDVAGMLQEPVNQKVGLCM